ncbi:MAG: carboxypeptidase-like regulatory domain-containing protein, partial [Saprospiraceae bacterium]
NHDAAQYIPTYDADGGILNSTNFSLSEGVVSATNNAWCASPNCLPDLKFGFRLAGDLSLSGNVCIDDGSKNGNCSTGTEEPLASMVLTIFNEAGDLLGGVTTNQTGSYRFPNLPEDSYVVHFAKEQISFMDYFFTTEIGATPALKIVEASKSILQKVLVQAAIFGVDFAFFPHPTIIAKDDFYTICPGLIFEHNSVSSNDLITNNLNRYQLLIPPTLGTVEMEVNGKFKYIPIAPECDRDKFTYQVCDLIAEVCDTANVSLVFEDKKAPTLLNIPPDLTINCDEQIPARTLVSAFDNCPSINVSLQETSSQGEDGCSLYDYTLTRTWIATDVCKNSTSATQIIEIEDKEPPSIFRIYTLPNGKKLVAGISKLVGAGWKEVSLPLNFETVPLIFNQIISANNSILPVVQTRNISSAQFEIRLQKEEAGNETYIHEKVAWIALEGGAQSTDFILNASTVLADTSPTEINFFTEFLSNPLLFTSLQTTNQQNLARVTYSNLTSSEVSVKLIETKNQELDRNITEEKVAYLGIENIGDLFDNKGNIIGEIGTKLINSGSNKIVLNHTYHNPIILVSPYNNVEHSSQLRVSELLNDNFQIQLSPLGASNFVPQPTSISYLVIEGSIPLPATDFCTNNAEDLQIGVDIVAIDNCDRLAVVSYSEQHDFNGTEQIINRSWQSSDECGNQVAYSQKIQCQGVGIVLQTFLQGALIGSKEEGLMRDDLRRKGLIPVNEPYSMLPNFKHIGSGGGEVIARELLEVTGPNAIVDWVFLELREAENFDTIVATSSGLLQRNGNVISVTGDSVVIFKNVPWGDYYITIRHRNHIGISSQNAYTFGLNTIPKIDFRNVFTATNGNYSSIKMSNTNAQWAGDTNGDEKIIYQGPNNDPSQMFYSVILDKKNSHYLTNYISRGYLVEDFNMDGITIYQGPNNDRSLLLYNTIFAHPNNRNFITNFIINIANGH